MEGIKMKCPKCQFANPEGVNFCVECGSKLEKICPECGYSNSLSHKFCGSCGRKLSLPVEALPKDLSFDEKLNKIQRYLPKGLTEKILSQRDRIEGERKQVTVMFCDMEGFTPLSEMLSIEEAYSFMDQIYEILIHKVHDYEGTVNEMTGDGIVALFGAPIALEDAPQRAIRSSLAIHREMAKFSDKLKLEKKVIRTVKMRVGIHTGPVVVGTLGNDLRVEFKAVGDTVNLASRVESLAVPGATHVTGETFKLTKGLFRFEALGEKQVKGKEEPVNVYRVIAPSTRRSRFDVSAEQGLAPFVGREREIELLLEGFERSKGGRGNAFSIISEAGLGKSRLLYEFRKAVASADVMFLEGRCLSYSRGIAYHPIIDILKANFDIRETDGDSEIIEKVKKGLTVLGADEASTLPYLLDLLSLKESGIDKISMSPEARKDRIIDIITRIALMGSEIQPLIMAFEDLHWIDKSSEESLKYLLDRITGVRIFLIFTYRPEFVHSWGGRSYLSQVTLNRLSNHESLAMLTHLLGTKEIEKDLEELILEKTEGIPFFIEEFTKSLRDLKVIQRKDHKYCLTKATQDVTIPSTIQDVIMARVDSLPENAKEVLQTGSVIEREFSYGLIKRVTGLSEKELLKYLSALKDTELLFERGIFPQSTYIFKHALTQEVVYESILTPRKKKLHGEIANAIEDLNKESKGEHYGVLAEHFIKGENYEKGAEYSRLAGKKAGKGASFNEAIAYCEKGISSLEKLPVAAETQKKLIDARANLGMYYNQANNFVLSKEAVEPIIDLAFKLDYKRRIAQIYTIKGSYSYAVEEDFPEAIKQLKEAIKFAKETNDFISLLMANHWMGHVLADNCEFETALYHLEKALNITMQANVLWGISAHKSCIARTVYCFKGDFNLGYQYSQEGLRLAEESGDIYSKAEAHTSLGFSYYGIGFLDEAEQHLLKAIDFCERINWTSLLVYAHQCLAETYFCTKEYQKSKDQYIKAIGILENTRMAPSAVNLYKISIARAMVRNNEKNIELGFLSNYAAKNKHKLIDGRMRRYIGEILLNIDDQHISDAEVWVKKSIEADKQNGVMFELGRDCALYAELFKRKEDQSKAKENLATAIEILQKCGADGWVEKYEKELAEL
jgi:class 3 adenylate cyclase/tetratricopeptide (TPR) repeat protein